MVVYCLDKDIREILTNIDRTTLDSIVIESFIAKAQSLIDTRLSKQYTIPFTGAPNTPPLIKTICIDIAGFYAMRTLFTYDSPNKSDWTLELYKTAIDLLNQLAEGKADLRDINGVIIPKLEEDERVYSRVKTYSPVFELDDPLYWAVSQNRLDDVADMRDE